MVEEIMPPKTTVPRARWLAEPAPKANRSGTTPMMNAKRGHHYRTKPPAGGFDCRFRDGHTALVQVTGELHDKYGVLARQGDHEDESDLGIEIIAYPRIIRARRTPTIATGTTRITAAGEVQLSYRAASTM